MCDLCGNENEVAIKRLKFNAEQLRRLAAQLEDMAEGRIKPHSGEAKIISSLAHHVIRYLVEEWL